MKRQEFAVARLPLRTSLTLLALLLLPMFILLLSLEQVSWPSPMIVVILLPGLCPAQASPFLNETRRSS